jgi:subtilisin family serine protease
LLPALVVTSAASAAERPARDSNVIEGRYIVVFEDSVNDVRAATEERERGVGFKSRKRFEHAVKGFSAQLNHGQVRALENDPKVDFVSQDRRVEASGNVGLAPGEPTPPTGVRRILSATTTTVREASGVNVAVIDTGIQLSHPDLVAANGVNCITPGTLADDDNGHGTHVAGSIAAKNNGAGVTGVAPDTKAYAVKVLAGDGGGSWESVMCGIDWVTANAATQNIEVANMSLSGFGQPLGSETCSTTTDALRKAVCNSTATGVTHVVAAGNSGWDFDYPSLPDVPAAYPEALTVSALSDSDGKSGGTGGAPSCRSGELDEYPATFSNYALTSVGKAHTIAAPGVCITSTWPGSSYGTISGTSMASPHMAGVAALCIKEKTVSGPCAGKTPAQNISYLRGDAQTYNNANTGYGFQGDPLRPFSGGQYYGYLTRTEPPTTPPTDANVYKSGSRLIFSASTGEANTVTVSRSSTVFTVKDTTAPLGAGVGCSQVDANTATCSTSGVSSLWANAKDGNDSVSVSAGATRSTLYGGSGNDTLIGGSSLDTLDGGTGADVMDGQGSTDTVTYTARTSSQPVTVTIDGVANDGQSGEGDNVKTNVENLVGGSGNDELTGSSAANIFDGRGGADVFTGLGGSDTADYRTRTSAQPVTVTIDGVANDGQSGEGDNVKTDVERVIGGAGDDTLKAVMANSVINLLDGRAGDDKIKTREGTTTKDRIYCGTGTDQYDRDASDTITSDCETPATLP